MEIFRVTPPYRSGIRSNHLEEALSISTPYHLLNFTKLSFRQDGNFLKALDIDG